MVEGFSGDLHPSVLCLHQLFLNFAEPDTCQALAYDCQEDNPKTTQESPLVVIEKSAECDKEEEWDSGHLVHIITQPKDTVCVDLNKVYNFTLIKVLISSFRYFWMFSVNHSHKHVLGSCTCLSLPKIKMLLNHRSQCLSQHQGWSIIHPKLHFLPWVSTWTISYKVN